ncbi:hypothetical protein EDD16DRAFT_1523576 [Pisolithus croceorrhizus]|nr:hypothetical protein EDD16DRAFT_1523576 [Pisolithus croceorrhizus]
MTQSGSRQLVRPGRKPSPVSSSTGPARTDAKYSNLLLRENMKYVSRNVKETKFIGIELGEGGCEGDNTTFKRQLERGERGTYLCVLENYVPGSLIQAIQSWNSMGPDDILRKLEAVGRPETNGRAWFNLTHVDALNVFTTLAAREMRREGPTAWRGNGAKLTLPDEISTTELRVYCKGIQRSPEVRDKVALSEVSATWIAPAICQHTIIATKYNFRQAMIGHVVTMGDYLGQLKKKMIMKSSNQLGRLLPQAELEGAEVFLDLPGLNVIKIPMAQEFVITTTLAAHDFDTTYPKTWRTMRAT